MIENAIGTTNNDADSENENKEDGNEHRSRNISHEHKNRTTERENGSITREKKIFLKESNKILKFHSQTNKRNMHCTAKVELANLLEKMAHIAILNTKLQIIYQVYKHGLMILRTYLT